MYLFSIRKAYDNGIESLYYGGEFVNDCFFREKDILEEDYSTPTLEGTYAVNNLRQIPRKDRDDYQMYLVKFMNGDGLILTDIEWKAGKIVTRKTYEALRQGGMCK